MPKISYVKTERIEIRITKDTKRLLQRAAMICGRRAGEFLLETGIMAAREVMANRRHIAPGSTTGPTFKVTVKRAARKKPQRRARGGNGKKPLVYPQTRCKPMILRCRTRARCRTSGRGAKNCA